MKWKCLLWLIFVTFSPLQAFGDYVPGRVRASAETKFSVLRGDGRFREIQFAHIVQYQTDGKGVTKFTIQLNREAPVPLVVTAIKTNSCGRAFFAQMNTDHQKSTLRITEISANHCRKQWPIEWQALLETTESAKDISRLTLRGEVEYFMLSQ